MGNKRCPTCGARYTGLERFCTKCGILLVREVNRCSENRTELCRHRTFEEGDVYCCYCGALTTYAAEKYQGEKERKEG